MKTSVEYSPIVTGRIESVSGDVLVGGEVVYYNRTTGVGFVVATDGPESNFIAQGRNYLFHIDPREAPKNFGRGSGVAFKATPEVQLTGAYCPMDE